ncbi:glycosyltransferase family 2 protein, partial [Rosenbergiella epipactidis]|uniref:glycosyltransferase family 2 protein n=1 Tax=Rosenbergiella epipactidis TaxID=1544694 RepID=UPI001F4DA81F
MTISSLMIKGICVGIILPVYNAESTINRCLDSIFAQSYSNWKLYIINDCSTDHVVELINKYTDDPRIVLINLSENKGVSYARNYGLNIADEDYISFIDSDDEWLPTKLSKQIRLLDQNTKIVLSNYFFIKSKKNKIISYYKDVLSI